jgi:hypothetical protein
MAGLTCVAGGAGNASSLCVATDSGGDVLSTSNPAAVNPTWTTTDVNGTNVMWDVSCPTTTFCVAGDVTGSILWGISGPAPTVTSISPTSGLPAGGNTVTITGSGFTGATGVDLGVVAATSFAVVSNTQITFATPKQTAGLHNVTVTGPTGTSADVSGDLYTDT